MEQGKAVYITPFRAGITDHGWPFDFGDDPAFCSAFASGGPITWGVCRRDVRRLAQPGDVVLFFSVEEPTPHFFQYKFCALLTVDTKIKQTEIWDRRTKAARMFRQYKNILIRPHDGGWEHWEPALPKKEWHNEGWLSRLTFHDDESDEFTRAQTKGFLSSNQAQRFIDENYVVFSTAPEQTFICGRPKVIATCGTPGQLESWRLQSPFARHVRSFTVAHTRGNLRIRNLQRPHRHSAWRAGAREIDRWRENFIEWLRKHCRELTKVSAFALTENTQPISSCR